MENKQNYIFLLILLVLVSACTPKGSSGGSNATSVVGSSISSLKKSKADAQFDSETSIRADAAVDGLMNNLWDSNSQYFDGDSKYWFYAQSIDVAGMAIARNRSKYSGLLAQLYAGQAERGFLQGTNAFYDDENWMALALSRGYQVTLANPALGEDPQTYLSTAQTLFADVMSAEMFDSNGNSQGVRWQYGANGRATASNAGPVITGMRLAQITGNSAYSAFAIRVYNFWFNTMVDTTSFPNAYRTSDFLNPDGSIVTQDWTYNNGLMIGAAVELYKATGDSRYLNDARNFANYMFAHESVQTPYGLVLDEVLCGRGCFSDLTQFKGIAMRYLETLLEVDPGNTVLQSFLSSSVSSLWFLSHDFTTNLFGFCWDGDTGQFDEGGQNSAALALGAASLYNIPAVSAITISNSSSASIHCDYSTGTCYNDAQNYAVVCNLNNGSCPSNLSFYWNSCNAPLAGPSSAAAITVHCDYSTGNCYNDVQNYALVCNLNQDTCPNNLIYYWNSQDAPTSGTAAPVSAPVSSPVTTPVSGPVSTQPSIHCDYSTGICYNDAQNYAFVCNLDNGSCPSNLSFYWNSNNAPPAGSSQTAAITNHCDYSTGNCYNDTQNYAYICNLNNGSCSSNMPYYWNSQDGPTN